MTTGHAARIQASKVRAGDRLLLNGYVRQVVRVETVGTGNEIQLRISFINGAATIVPCTDPFEVQADAPGHPTKNINQVESLPHSGT